jgi:hypothetical protein
MRQLFSPRFLTFTIFTLCFAVAAPAMARKKRPPPTLQLVIKKGSTTLGTEVLRTKTTKGEAKTYHSTKTKMRQNGRRFVHRTHTVFDPKGNLVTYDRWLDVKGATLRIRVFRFKDTFKKVEFAQNPKKKNKIATIKAGAPLVVLDERSPTLLDLAITRFATQTTLNWVRADDLSTGTMTLAIERLVDGAGAKWSRYRLSGKGLKATVLRGPKGKAVHIDTGWGFTGTAKGAKVPKDLKPDPSAASTSPKKADAESGVAEKAVATTKGNAAPKADGKADDKAAGKKDGKAAGKKDGKAAGKKDGKAAGATKPATSP